MIRTATSTEGLPHSSPSEDELRQVGELTQRVFGQPAEFRAVVDPDGGDTYVDVEVRIVGTDEEVARQANEWHRALGELRVPSTFCFSPKFD